MRCGALLRVCVRVLSDRVTTGADSRHPTVQARSFNGRTLSDSHFAVSGEPATTRVVNATLREVFWLGTRCRRVLLHRPDERLQPR